MANKHKYTEKRKVILVKEVIGKQNNVIIIILTCTYNYCFVSN